MLNKNKYWKALLGTFAEVLIAKQVDYVGTGASAATAGTFTDFCANAVEGEFGFFNASTMAAISGATSGSPAAVTAVGSTVTIFGAVKRDGAIEKTESFKLADFPAIRTPYSAPVAQVSKATISGTPVAGEFYSVKIIETTPGYQPFPMWEYGYVAKTGDSLTTVGNAIAALMNDKTNVINKDTDSITTCTYSSGVFTITATSGGPTFRIAYSYSAINTLGATSTYTGAGTAAGFWGNGTYDQVKELEQEADVFKGVTTQYPNQGANPENFGKPTVFATSGVTYNIYVLKGYGIEASPTPLNQTQQKRTIILAIPSNGSANAEAEVKGILGL